MSRRILTLPIRALSSKPTSSTTTQWVCRRCLSTKSASIPSATDLPLDMPIESKPSNPAVSENSHHTAISQKKSSTPTQLLAERNPSLKTSQDVKNLRQTLRAGLPHKINAQYLYHVPEQLLTVEERKLVQSAAAQRPKQEAVGVVVDSGKMDRTVRVRIPGQRWEARIGKYYQDHTTHLVHDPNNSLVTGDVVSLHRLRVSTAVHYVVSAIVTPFGKPIDQRPPILTPEQRLAAYKEKRFAKLDRRSLRRKAAMGDSEAIQKLRAMGLDAGAGVAAGLGESVGTEKGAGRKRTPAKGALLGKKGQKLPEGVLPGGKHEVGPIGARARWTKQKAEILERKTKENLKEAELKGQQLEGLN